MLNELLKDQIIKLQNRYPEKRSALLPALHLAQTQEGYLPIEIQKEIATLFDLDTTEVTAVVTFYDMFFDKPQGKHTIHVCKNISCMLKGSDEILAKLKEKLAIPDHCTVSEDKNFTVIASECLGACDKAPMAIAGDQVIGPIKIEDLDKVIDVAKKCSHPCPVTGVCHE